MSVAGLTEAEHATLQAYVEIAKSRNTTHANPDTWRAEAEALKGVMQGRSVLDIGCGGGRDALLLRGLGLDYTGIDLSPEMLAAARVLVPDGDFRLMSLYQLGLPSASFDAFWAAAVYLHVPRARIGEALEEARRILCLAGVGFIALKEGNGEETARDGRFFTYWQEEEFSRVLSDSGFLKLACAKRDIVGTTFLTWHVMAANG